MRVGLFDFQEQALEDLRHEIDEAHQSYDNDEKQQIITLSAPTGSGKTIIIAATVESIFYGDDKHVGEPDSVFIWLSDSPELNEQSKTKFELKSDKIALGNLITLDDSFDQPVFEPGNIYFLNTQKLGLKKRLVTKGDTRTFTIWNTIQNTVEDMPSKVYLIIDEAHKGTATPREDNEAQSIMQKFVLGSNDDELKPMPLIIGMSATTQRFEKLVNGISAKKRNVDISVSDVKKSGLLKDDISIEYPDSDMAPETAMLEGAVDDWMRKVNNWAAYCHNNPKVPFVNPALIIQVSDGDGAKPTKTDLSHCLKVIQQRCNIKLTAGEVAHTFNDHDTLNYDGLDIYKIDPSSIEDAKEVKIVFFKMNLSTGWDCPRAETMMSYRTATDATYIAQLLGRMVRTPLARHIPGEDFLNSVELFLPHFDKDTADKVAALLKDDIPSNISTHKQGENENVFLTSDVEDELPLAPEGHSDVYQQPEVVKNHQPDTLTITKDAANHAEENKQSSDNFDVQNHTQVEENSNYKKESDDEAKQYPVYFQPRLLKPSYSEIKNQKHFNRKEIIQKINSSGLITYSVDAVKDKDPLKSLLELSNLLVISGIYTSAIDDVKSDISDFIHSYIDEEKRNGTYQDKVNKITNFTLIKTVIDPFGNVQKAGSSAKSYITTLSDIDNQFDKAEKILRSGGISKAYLKRYPDENITEAMLEVIVFANDDIALNSLKKEAFDQFNEMHNKWQHAAAGSTQKVRDDFNKIGRLASNVMDQFYNLPFDVMMNLNGKGKIYHKHLYSKTGGVQIDLNGWEDSLIQHEMHRDDAICWLRNPVKKEWSLCIPYDFDGTTKPMYPDMIVIRQIGFDYIFDILEPHEASLNDNKGKAIGLAKYVENNSNPRLGRVQLIRKNKDGTFVRLDLSKRDVRQKVLHAASNQEIDNLFNSDGIVE